MECLVDEEVRVKGGKYFRKLVQLKRTLGARAGYHQLGQTFLTLLLLATATAVRLSFTSSKILGL